MHTLLVTCSYTLTLTSQLTILLAHTHTLNIIFIYYVPSSLLETQPICFTLPHTHTHTQTHTHTHSPSLSKITNSFILLVPAHTLILSLFFSVCVRSLFQDLGLFEAEFWWMTICWCMLTLLFIGPTSNLGQQSASYFAFLSGKSRLSSSWCQPSVRLQFLWLQIALLGNNINIGFYSYWSGIQTPDLVTN